MNDYEIKPNYKLIKIDKDRVIGEKIFVEVGKFPSGKSIFCDIEKINPKRRIELQKRLAIA